LAYEGVCGRVPLDYSLLVVIANTKHIEELHLLNFLVIAQQFSLYLNT